MARNKKGQITGDKSIETAIKKSLLAVAKDEGIRLKAMVRDELERELRLNIYDSYMPATKKGKETREYNETHKHQKPSPYHHTGLLAKSVYATIEGDTIKAMVKDEQYKNGTSTTKLYNYLKFGTTDTPKKSVYGYNNGKKFARYVAQEPHNFEARTREYMRNYLNEIEIDINANGAKRINPKYLKKLKKSDM